MTPSTENYFPIICLNLSGSSYSRLNFKNNYRNTFTFFEFKNFDNSGIPIKFEEEYFTRMILHEYIHSFTNRIVDRNIKTLKGSAEAILANPIVAEKVKNTFYNNYHYLLYETLVRATSIKYLKENEEMQTTIEKEIEFQEKSGFFWIKGIVNLSDKYSSNRKKYKCMDDFMPEIGNYFYKIESEFNNGTFVFPTK